jgi:hypothetical protein
MDACQTSSSSAFHLVIRKILDGCVSILDDILIYCRTVAEHDKRLRHVLERLAKYNPTVHRDKCIICVPEVDFNGHRLTAAGIRPLHSNVEAIRAMPVPLNATQLLQLVCTAAYYLKFVPDFAEICEPLRQLFKADAVWNW